MKRLHLLLTALLALVSGLYSSIHAQDILVHEDKIDWKEYATDPTKLGSEDEFYLCHVHLNKEGKADYHFINAGGAWGVYTILADRGIVMKLEKETVGNNTYYYFRSAIENPIRSSYMGISGNTDSDNGIALDRKKETTGETRWELEQYISNEENTAKNFGDFAYEIKNNHTGKYFQSNGDKTEGLIWSAELKSKETNQTVPIAPTDEAWLFIKQDVVDIVISRQDASKQTLIDVSGILRNTRFVRNARVKYWKFYDYDDYINNIETELTYDIEKGAYKGDIDNQPEFKNAFISMNPHLGWDKNDYYARDFGRFGAAGLKDQIIMNQRADNLLPGTYIVTAQAFFANVDKGDNATSTDAYLYASTNNVHNSVRIPILSQDQQTVFNQFIDKHTAYLGDAANYFRYNVAAGEFIRRGGVYTETNNDHQTALNSKFLRLQVAVMVRPDEGNTMGLGHLTVSVAKTADVGRVFITNVKVYYAGPYEFGVDAYNTDPDKLDKSKYSYPQRFNLRRDFGVIQDITEEEVNNKAAETHWEPLVLPVNVKVREVRNAFGGLNDSYQKLADVKLSKLVGIAEGGRVIRFKSVDLTNPDDPAIDAGECYVIKVSAAPPIERKGKYDFKSLFTPNNEDKIEYDGPVYYFTALTRDYDFTTLVTKDGKQYDDKTGKVTKTYETTDTDGKTLKLNFTGYFCRPTTADGSPASAPAGSYVMSGGKMYHLKNPWNRIMGTSWYLEVPEEEGTGGTQPANIMSFVFDDEDGNGTTAISGIPEANGSDASYGIRTALQGIYNLNGQKIASGTDTANLPKGIYIVNGKKYVVK